MNRRLAVLDLICYAAIPYLMWTYGREPLGDYLAILLSTAPGFIYTIYRFIMEKQFNITGLFIISSLLITTTVNLMSSTAENMLWNQVYLGYGFAFIFLFSILIKKPLALYFAVDVSYLQGHPRKHSRALFYEKGLFFWFQLLSLVLVIRGVFLNSLKAFLITTQGVNGYDQMIIYMTVSGWVFNVIIIVGSIFVSSRIMNFIQASSEPENGGQIEEPLTDEALKVKEGNS